MSTPITTARRATTHPSAEHPLAAVLGANLQVPLATGGTARYVNLDYAASAPVLANVQDVVDRAAPLYASVHRGAGYPSRVTTAAYEGARRRLFRFVDARPDDVAVFTHNTTDALNLLAYVVPGEVVYLDLEHHANLLPWQRIGGRVVQARVTPAATLAALDEELAGRPAALLSVTGASNVTGEVLPIEQLASLAHRHGTRLAVDAAQLLPHRRVSLSESGADYVAFSGHKLYAPYGVGALVGRRDWLDGAPAYRAGGGSVREVRLSGTTWLDAPERHEAGTPAALGALALAAACTRIDEIGYDRIVAHERALRRVLVDGLTAIPGVTVLAVWPDPDGSDAAVDTVGVLSFVVAGHPAGLIAEYLSAEHGIGVRAGRFCAHPLLTRLLSPPPQGVDESGTAVRASIGLGSRLADAHALVGAIATLVQRGPGLQYRRETGEYRPAQDLRTLPDWLAAAVDEPELSALSDRFGTPPCVDTVLDTRAS